ncbi:HipA domain-containing protein [Candidatus Desantisbacteria bacterium]|nr:HipA domain-containing protein [Candidatus Desantisbacteria bacterium]
MRKKSFWINEIPKIDLSLSDINIEAQNMAGKISISGVQPKISVKINKPDNKIVVAAEAGEYIVKPQSQTFYHLPENEFTCTILAKKIGINVPGFAVLKLRANSFAYIVKRFDRNKGDKIHVEDFAAITTEIVIYDNGEGIFKKIQRELSLLDERHSVLELSKGKLTTDPENHTGEGIFFSSRMFDHFAIISGSVCFSHKNNEIDDWVLEPQKFSTGTGVFMTLKNNTSRTTKEVFDKFTSGEDYGFTKTIVPVRLAQYGNEKLISRSQAKRLLVRIDKFKIVIFDFDGVATIGQAFADEIFRVYNKKNPNIEIITIKTNKNIDQIINRVKNNKSD